MRQAAARFGMGGSLLGLACALLLAVPAAHAQTPEGTMLSPRGRADYEKALAELNRKYGPGKNEALKEAVLSANRLPENTLTGEGLGGVMLPAGINPGQRIKIELLPHGAGQYLFQDEVYDSESLSLALAEVQKVYTLASVLLIEDAEHPIQVDHLLGLARVGRALGVPTAYKQGEAEQVLSAQ